ncbi:hypothetical protein [Stygiolobus caldivivus]|nr:hypothetical protein [Stygiolobus caldivivus]
MLLSKDDIGVDKILRKNNDNDECEIYVAEKGNNVFIIGIFEGRHTKYYFKVAPAFTGSWSCEELVYFPFGYFGFSDNESELKIKLREKLKELETNVLK